MTTLDYLVLSVYIVGVFAIGAVFSGKNQTSEDMFTAGGQSPWWVSGTSGFMTMFSAGTFVVWGGIAYRLGAVAISISLCYGIAALIVGYRIAARWKATGVTSGAEFIRLRFGKNALRFFTWAGIVYKMIGTSVSLYAISLLLCTLAPLPEGFPFRDPESGNLALTWSVLLFGGVIVLYTVAGGLWAVLMTDVLQFIVLAVAVTLLVPLALDHEAVGGLSGFLQNAPDGFFAPTAGEFTWFFLAGWTAIHVFMIGAEWAFVQRFVCVGSERDARKSAWLFGVLYLISPVIWMLPPMAYRLINPDAPPEEAYILACREVLPAGMLGLMLAAMLSATASLVDSQLNVFSGVLTRDFFRHWRKGIDERALARAGRAITLLLGAIVIALALLVPHAGGATNITLTVASLMVGPLLAPTLWGLLSPRIGARAVWWTVGITFPVSLAVKVGLGENGFLASALPRLALWAQTNARMTDLLVGLVLPVAVLAFHEWRSRSTSPGWKAVEAHQAPETNARPESFLLPARMIGINTVGLALLLLVIGLAQEKVSALIFGSAVLLLAIGGGILLAASRAARLREEPVVSARVLK